MQRDDRPGVNDVMHALMHPDVQHLVARLRAHRPIEQLAEPGVQYAAVAAVLRVTTEPELLFIKRAEFERDPWSGHVAFPGGRYQAGDESLLATAMRETMEELALVLPSSQIVGQLDDLVPRSRNLPSIIVRPFVAVVANDVVLQRSEEVAATFWVPLTLLRHPSSTAEHVLTVNDVRVSFPAYRVDAHLVWGLTERIVRQLLSFLD